MPQLQGIPPQDAVERIVAAVDQLAAAKIERDEAIADALKRGGSVRQVAAVAGMSERQIQTIGHARGWPTAAQKRKWAAEKAERDAWNERFMPKPANPR